MSNFFFKDVTLLITHYNRSHSLKRLLLAFRALNFDFESVVVSDDGSSKEHLDQILILQTDFSFNLITTPVNKGLGNNLNKGQDAVKTRYTLYVQEDFVPTALFPEKFTFAVDTMNKQSDLDMIRFYAYFKYPYLKPYANGFSKMIFNFYKSGYKKFYFYSDHPHLRRSSFFDKFGRYAENIGADQTEYRMMISFLKNKGTSLFYENFKDLFDQINSSDEPSTIKRNKLRESNNIIVKSLRHFYRHIKFNYDLIR